jgi:hypothetical protein
MANKENRYWSINSVEVYQLVTGLVSPEEPESTSSPKKPSGISTKHDSSTKHNPSAGHGSSTKRSTSTKRPTSTKPTSSSSSSRPGGGEYYEKVQVRTNPIITKFSNSKTLRHAYYSILASPVTNSRVCRRPLPRRLPSGKSATAKFRFHDHHRRLTCLIRNTSPNPRRRRISLGILCRLSTSQP